MTASFKLLPGLKDGDFEAAMPISRPVWGLRPILAGLSFTENVPNPTRVIESPVANAVSIVLVKASSASPALAFDKLAFSAIALISCALFMWIPWIS